MPARLSGAFPRASTRAAAAAYSRAEPVPPACPSRNRATPPGRTPRPGTVTSHATPRARAGCGECNPQQLKGETRSTQQGAKLLPSTAGLLPGRPVTGLLPKTLPSTPETHGIIFEFFL